MQYFSTQDGDVTRFGSGRVAPEGSTVFDDAAEWLAAMDAYRADPPELRAFETVKADAVRRAIARADAFTAPVLSAYPAAERAGWDKREAEARAIVGAADAAGDVAAAIGATLIVKALADAGGWTEAETVDKARSILVKAAEFAAISAAVETMRDRAVTAIEAAADTVELAATLQTLDAEATALAAQFGLG
ncbi:MAG: hypothetical protein NXH91_12155 [Phyllobacteriaceae bacterium]|nr:hypothetical protein [Phyllobacteriaceae bacterium]